VYTGVAECFTSRLIHPRSRFVSGTLDPVCTNMLVIFILVVKHHLLTGVLFLSGMLLLYTAIIAPAQVFLWEFNEVECNTFPTLYFDIAVDLFFLVNSLAMKF
jgi:hypothetical protein